ncbi:MAG TPA: hypothetical protein VGB17_17390 [Pyrinomonadaceae bacterium]|jgi:hypothetical protein
MSEQLNPPVEESPTEKIREEDTPGSKIPGSQNVESEEIKEEKNPNTE